MKNLVKAQDGIAPLLIILVLAVVAVAGVTTFVVAEKQKDAASVSQVDDELNDAGDENDDPQETAVNEDQAPDDGGSNEEL